MLLIGFETFEKIGRIAGLSWECIGVEIVEIADEGRVSGIEIGDLGFKSSC